MAPRLIDLPFPGEVPVEVMTSGYSWNGAIIRYSVSDGLEGESWEDSRFATLPVGEVFSTFDRYIAPDFVDTGSFDDPQSAAAAGSRVNLTVDREHIAAAISPQVLAIGLFPDAGFAEDYFDKEGLSQIYYSGLEGDVLFSLTSQAVNYSYTPGAAGYWLALHEIGHALGLKHSGDDGGVEHLTFRQANISHLDIDYMTVMSYKDQYSWNLEQWDAATPMILDVLALQGMYGADPTTNSGATSYSLSAADPFYETIYDAGGLDTLDLSDYGMAAHVELPQYRVFADQVAPFGLVTTRNDAARLGNNQSPQTLKWVLGTIETLIGTPFGDVIIGSDTGETIRAGAGDDEMYLGAGNDIVDGGAGQDKVYLLSAFAQCAISVIGGVCYIDSAADGRKILTGVETFVFDHDGQPDTRMLADLGPGPIVPLVRSDWVLFSPTGHTVSASGIGEVYGTSGRQTISVLPAADAGGHGIVRFDPSFNGGGDVVRLEGNAADWQAARSGSSVALFDGRDFVEIPAGPAGLTLAFDDGMRTLRVDLAAQQIKIGTFAVGADYATILSAPQGLTAPPSDPSALGKLTLFGGGEVTIGGSVEIYGAQGHERISLLPGGDVSFDPSFNQGGDEIVLSGMAGSWEGARFGSSAVFTKDGDRIEIPVGPVAAEITFDDGTWGLLYDPASRKVLLGDHELGFAAAPLSFA